MSDFYKFSDIVFPIIKIELIENSKAKFIRFLGSGFHIGNDGYFLTAKHVINEKSFKDIKKNEKYAIQHFIEGEFKLFFIDYIEDNDEEIDISLGHINSFDVVNKKFFSLNEQSKVYGWHDVHAFGYPEYLVTNIPKTGQFLKGYITREINKGEIVGTIVAPASYATNFPIPKGMSGCPLFKTGKDHPLIGICIGSFETTLTLWENIVYEDNSEKITEKSQRVIENGLILNIFDLKTWNIKKTKTTLQELF